MKNLLLRDYLLGQAERLREFEAMVRESDDPEGVHQLRVTSRRIRAVLSSAFVGRAGMEEVCALVGELRWVLRALGKARDLDVLIGGLRETGGSDCEDATQHLEEQRKIRQAQIIDILDSGRYAELQIALAQFLTVGLDQDAGLNLDDLCQQILASELPRIRRLCKAGRRGKRTHRLRIRLKRLRYALEPFAGVYGCGLESFLKRLGKFQTRLGDSRDASILLRELDAISVDKATRRHWQRRARRLRKKIRNQDLPRLRKFVRRKQLRKLRAIFDRLN